MLKKIFFSFIVIATLVLGGLYFYPISLTNHTDSTDSNKNVLFLASTQTLGGKGILEIYHEMKKENLNVKVAAIPYFYYGKKLSDIDLDFFKNFDPQDVIYPFGKQEPYGKLEQINFSSFDWVFTQNPYNTYINSILAPDFLIEEMKQKTKIAFLTYYPHIFYHNIGDHKAFDEAIDLVFIDSQSTKDIFVERFNLPESKVVVSGYVPYREIRKHVPLIKSNESEKKVLLWLPRWVQHFHGRHDYEAGSTFMNYYLFFYNFAKNNPDYTIIFRPHTLLFKSLVGEKNMSEQDIKEYVDRFTALDNVQYSEHLSQNLVDDVLASDIVISDGSTALAEVVIAEKPIIYLSNGWDNEFNGSELSRDLKNIVNLAYSAAEIENLIYNIPPIDSKKVKALKTKLDPVENPAAFIAKYIKRD